MITALDQIIGRLSVEPHVTAATWQVDRAVPEAWGLHWRVRKAGHPRMFDVTAGKL